MSSDEIRQPDQRLMRALNYQFQNTELYEQALTHRSYHNEFAQKSSGHNERLEFLGDAVLDLVLSDLLMRRFEHLTEGELSKVRASLVNEQSLSEMAIELGIENLMRLGKGEIQSGGAAKPRLLACAFEALVAAIFKDAGYELSAKVIEQLFIKRIDNLDLMNHFKSDYKTRLQEMMQQKLKQIPIYELEKEEGPDHDKVFYVTVKIDSQIMAKGMGRTKKQAEQDAARIVLETL